MQSGIHPLFLRVRAGVRLLNQEEKFRRRMCSNRLRHSATPRPTMFTPKGCLYLFKGAVSDSNPPCQTVRSLNAPRSVYGTLTQTPFTLGIDIRLQVTSGQHCVRLVSPLCVEISLLSTSLRQEGQRSRRTATLKAVNRRCTFIALRLRASVLLTVLSGVSHCYQNNNHVLCQ